MITEGRLAISAGISRLDHTRLMRGALDNGGFGRATSFLRQERQLESGDRIFVDGVDREFDQMDVIGASSSARLLPTTCDEDLLGRATSGTLMKCSSRSTDAFITYGVRSLRTATFWTSWSKAKEIREPLRSSFASC